MINTLVDVAVVLIIRIVLHPLFIHVFDKLVALFDAMLLLLNNEIVFSFIISVVEFTSISFGPVHDFIFQLVQNIRLFRVFFSCSLPTFQYTGTIFGLVLIIFVMFGSYWLTNIPKLWQYLLWLLVHYYWLLIY